MILLGVMWKIGILGIKFIGIASSSLVDSSLYHFLKLNVEYEPSRDLYLIDSLISSITPFTLGSFPRLVPEILSRIFPTS